MPKKVKHKNSISLISMQDVDKYHMLWQYHSKNEDGKPIYAKWYNEVYAIVLKVYNYENYNRVLQGGAANYKCVFNAVEYFMKIGNQKAYENMAWKLNSFFGLKKYYKEAIKEENFEKANVLHQAIKLTAKPDEYIIDLNEKFFIQKQNIIADIDFLEKEKKRQDALNAQKPRRTFYESAIKDSQYILLGNYYSRPRIIAKRIRKLQRNPELSTMLIWYVNTFHKEFKSKVMRELKAFRSLKILRILESFPTNEKELSEIERNYFDHICTIIKEEKEIGKAVLLAALKYYKTASNRQKEILEQAKQKNLKDGLEYAVKLEEYEIAGLINSFILNNI